MTWFPTFLNGWYAAGAAAVVVPALLLLYFLKLRRRELPVSSTLLWRKSVQDLQVNAPFQRLRRNLLLILQMLLLLLLALALSRPVVNYTPPPGGLAVILIDRSASMSAFDGKIMRLDQAKKAAGELIDAMPRGGRAMIIAFDDSAQTVQPFTTDTNALHAAVDAITPTDRPTRLKLAYEMADANMTVALADQNFQQTAKPDVYLISDGRALDADNVSLQTPVKFEQIGSPDTPNIAIVTLTAKRNYQHPTQVQVFARLANFGPNPVSEVGVQLSVDGQVRSAGVASLLPDRYTEEQRRDAIKDGFVPRDSIEFPDMDITAAAVIKVEQTATEHDALPADDVAYAVVPPAKQLNVLVVGNGNYFLDKALSVLALKKPDALSPPDYERKLPTDYDVIIFDRYSPKKLPPLGGFIYLGAVPPNLTLKAVMAPDGTPAMNSDVPVTVLDWKHDHPILRDLILSKIVANGQIKLLPTLDSEVLIDGSGGPLLILHHEGRGTHLVLAFDPLQSNWPLRASFPVFLQNAMEYLALGSDMNVRQSYQPGQAVRIPRVDLQKMDSIPARVRVVGPFGSTAVDVPPTGDFALPAMDRVGLYTTEPPIPGFEQIAVNLLDANESNLIPASTAPGGGTTPAIAAGSKTRLELWWWIVVAAIGLSMIEWWVYTRRVHL
jgi:Ca-activated chloride channel family protein